MDLFDWKADVELVFIVVDAGTAFTVRVLKESARSEDLEFLTLCKIRDEVVHIVNLDLLGSATGRHMQCGSVRQSLILNEHLPLFSQLNNVDMTQVVLFLLLIEHFVD